MDKNPVKNMMQSILLSENSTYREAQIDSLVDKYSNGTQEDKHTIFKEYYRFKNEKFISRFENLWDDLSITDPQHPANLIEISTNLFNRDKDDVNESQRASVLMTTLFHIPNELGDNGFRYYMMSKDFEDNKANILRLLLSRDDNFESDLDDPQVKDLIDNIWDRFSETDKQELLTSTHMHSITPTVTNLNTHFLHELQMTRSLDQDDYDRFALINDGFSASLGNAKKMINKDAFLEQRNASTLRYINRVKTKINDNDGFRNAYNFIIKSDESKCRDIDASDLQEQMQIFVYGLHELYQDKAIKESPVIIIDPEMKTAGGYSRQNNSIILNPSLVKNGSLMFVLNHEFRHFVQYELAESSDPTKNDFRNDIGQMFKQDLASYSSCTMFSSIEDQEVKETMTDVFYRDQLVEIDANLYGYAIATMLPEQLEREVSIKKSGQRRKSELAPA